MMAAAHKPPPQQPLVDVDDLLQGWDEIASRLRRSPSYCKYMASDRQPAHLRLPVWRLGPGKRSPPVITMRELAAWASRWQAHKESSDE